MTLFLQPLPKTRRDDAYSVCHGITHMPAYWHVFLINDKLKYENIKKRKKWHYFLNLRIWAMMLDQYVMKSLACRRLAKC